ncbi:type III secretion system export apparatus subunit SctT [Nitratireductor pacificus]|uniref:RhcT, Surface presentation of antigens protein spaR n=1 Tax=Nitratireductor pacificus pht-3B TaxID=391937 RepID=K2LJ13_9HYPH|nr:type III secretion system export apparatus subunit SctT [Nitratireductor pacificus]EKF17684.1 RhcT, Surface presentation of antigens protein spaR [Nitratireductor pacificus pht-3B]
MPTNGLVSPLTDLLAYVLAAGVATARMAALMTIMPLFTRIRLSGLLRTGLALALVVPIFPMVVDELGRNEMATMMILLYLFKEVLVGLVLALVLGVPFWAAEAAGDIVDLQRGSMMGNLIDPSMSYETSITGTFLAVVMIMVYLAAGGLELTLESLYGSYELWPLDHLLPRFSEETALAFLDLLTRILMMALTLMFPLIVSLLLSDIVFAFLARASPHLNVFALSLVAKTLVYSLVFALYAAFLITYAAQDLRFLGDASGLLEAFACRSCR